MGWNCPNTKRARRPFYLNSKQSERPTQLPAWPISSQVAIYGDGNERAPQRLIQEPWVPFPGKRGPNQSTGLSPRKGVESASAWRGLRNPKGMHCLCFRSSLSRNHFSGCVYCGYFVSSLWVWSARAGEWVIYLFGSQVSRPWNISRQ